MSDPGFTSIDFSEFHPLDHSLKNCIGYPGGRLRHLKYAWNYQWREEVYRRTLCRVGRHEDAWSYRAKPVSKIEVRCHNCGRPCTDVAVIQKNMAEYLDPKWPWNRGSNAEN